MARKGSQPRNGFDGKTSKFQNLVPGSLDTSFAENKEKKEKNDYKLTSCDQQNGDFPFIKCNSFAKKSLNTEICKQVTAGTAIIEENNLSDETKLLDNSCNLIKLSGSCVGEFMNATTDWTFRYASYCLNIGSIWIKNQKPRISSLISFIHKACDYCVARTKFVFPVILTCAFLFGKLVLLLSLFWMNCSIRGFNSLLHLGTVSLFTVLWCSLISIIAMVGFIKLFILMVIAFLLLLFTGIAPAILVLAISAIVGLWFYGSFWTTSLVALLGGISFGFHHERIALIVTVLYSMHSSRSYVGWIGLFLGLNLSFLSSDALIYLLKDNNANGHSRGSVDYSHEIPLTTGRGMELTSEEEVARLLSCNDHYAALGFNLFENVDVSVLKKEYRKRAILVHPDKNLGSEKAVEAFKKLQNAYEVLLDSIKRKNYDADLRRDELLNYIRSFQASSRKNERQGGIFSSESTNIDAEDRGFHGESRKIFCKKCGTFHIWTPVERSKSLARWCQDCKDFHPAKDGDGWLEQSSIPFIFGLLQKVDIPHAYACAESRIYDATQWFNCQEIRVRSNTHKPSFHVNITFNSKHNGSSRASSSNMGDTMTEEDFYEWVQNAINLGRFEPDAAQKEGSFHNSSHSKPISSKKKRKGKRQW